MQAQRARNFLGSPGFHALCSLLIVFGAFGAVACGFLLWRRQRHQKQQQQRSLGTVASDGSDGSSALSRSKGPAGNQDTGSGSSVQDQGSASGAP